MQYHYETPQQAVVHQAVAALDQGIVAQQQAKAALFRSTTLGGNIASATQEDAKRSLEQAQRETGLDPRKIDGNALHEALRVLIKEADD